MYVLRLKDERSIFFSNAVDVDERHDEAFLGTARALDDSFQVFLDGDLGDIFALEAGHERIFKLVCLLNDFI